MGRRFSMIRAGLRGKEERAIKNPKGLHAGSRWWKWSIQALFFSFFLALFVVTQYPWRRGVPYRFFLDLDPFHSLASLAGTRQFIWLALAFLLVGLLAGRIFCGYACPLGFCIDLTDRLLGKTRPDRTRRHTRGGGTRDAPSLGAGSFSHPSGVPRLYGLQWIVLGTLVMGLLFRNSLPLALDPIALLTRSLTLAIYPPVLWAFNGAIGLLRPLAERLGWYEVAYLSIAQPGFQGGVENFLLLLIVFGLGLFATRFWCRYVCPLGALLGVSSRFAPFQRRVQETCTECGQCRSVCPMGAIGDDPHETKRSVCIQCRSCKTVCPEDAIVFPLKSPRDARTVSHPEGISRRGLVFGMGAGGVFLLLTRLDPRVMKRTGRRLRPPGAVPEEDFLVACVRCGACVRICVTHTLQASGMEGGLIRWGTPFPNFRVAGCEQQCNLCGNICPTGAIRSLSLVERQHAKIGTALLRRERCVAWAKDRLCLLCDEACPYNAIVFKEIEGHKRPLVDESRCNGCGMCEYVCPVQGEAAIVVYPDGELRLKQGSYKEVLNRARIFLKPKRDLMEPPHSS